MTRVAEVGAAGRNWPADVALSLVLVFDCAAEFVGGFVRAGR